MSKSYWHISPPLLILCMAIVVRQQCTLNPEQISIAGWLYSFRLEFYSLLRNKSIPHDNLIADLPTPIRSILKQNSSGLQAEVQAHVSS